MESNNNNNNNNDNNDEREDDECNCAGNPNVNASDDIDGPTTTTTGSTTTTTTTTNTTPASPNNVATHDVSATTTNINTSSIGDPLFYLNSHLEAFDRKSASLVCVASVIGIDLTREDSLRIHFDGWTDFYDYWARPDSDDLHPIGYCAANGLTLQAPKSHVGTFDWNTYLAGAGRTPEPPPPMDLHVRSPQPGFCVRPFDMVVDHTLPGLPLDFLPRTLEMDEMVGTRLEVADPSDPTYIGVATILQVDTTKEDSFLIHFDGLGHSDEDFWARPDSHNLHLPGYCQAHGFELNKPHGYFKIGEFTWSDYMEMESECDMFRLDKFVAQVCPPDRPLSIWQSSKQSRRNDAMNHIDNTTTTKPEARIEIGMRLEAVDPKYPQFTSVATVVNIRNQTELLIHFDGWPHSLDHWTTADSPDLHPVGWCDHTHTTLSVPRHHDATFNWKSYLEKTSSIAVPVAALADESNQGVVSTETEAPELQWISKVVDFSSEYNNFGWSANSVVGKPKVFPNYGDSTGTWAPKTSYGEIQKSTLEYLDVEFAHEVIVTEERPIYISILETYYPGAIVSVGVGSNKASQSGTGPNLTTKWTVVWKGDAYIAPHTSRVFYVKVDIVGLSFDRVLITVDPTLQPHWPEIDAVCIGDKFIAKKPQAEHYEQVTVGVHKQWASEVLGFSSQYNDSSWSAPGALGPPSVFPRYGDLVGTWAPRPSKGALEYIELRFADEMFPVAAHTLEIYETYNPGAITKISIRKTQAPSHPLADTETWEVVWSRDAEAPLPPKESRIFRPLLKPVDYFWKDIRIDMDTHGQLSWSEIDAVCVLTEQLRVNIASPYPDLPSLFLSVHEARIYNLKEKIATKLKDGIMAEEFTISLQLSSDHHDHDDDAHDGNHGAEKPTALVTDLAWLDAWKDKNPYDRMAPFTPTITINMRPLEEVSVYIARPALRGTPLVINCAVSTHESTVAYLMRKIEREIGLTIPGARISSKDFDDVFLNADNLLEANQEVEFSWPEWDFDAYIDTKVDVDGENIALVKDLWPSPLIEVTTLDGSSVLVPAQIRQRKRQIGEELVKYTVTVEDCRLHPQLQNVYADEVEFDPGEGVNSGDLILSNNTKMPCQFVAMFRPMKSFALKFKDTPKQNIPVGVDAVLLSLQGSTQYVCLKIAETLGVGVSDVAISWKGNKLNPTTPKLIFDVEEDWSAMEEPIEGLVVQSQKQNCVVC